MAKQRDEPKGPQPGRPADPKDFEVPAGAEEPAADRASVGAGGEAAGRTVYPPPPSDQAGERTAAVPPQKQLPTEAPPEEKPVPGGRPGPARAVPAAGQAIRDADAELSRLRAENAEYRRRLGEPEPGAEPRAAAEEGEPFRVSCPDHPNLPALEVAAKDPEAAKAAYLRRAGIWAPPGPLAAVRVADLPRASGAPEPPAPDRPPA